MTEDYIASIINSEDDKNPGTRRYQKIITNAFLLKYMLKSKQSRDQFKNKQNFLQTKRELGQRAFLVQPHNMLCIGMNSMQ